MILDTDEIKFQSPIGFVVLEGVNGAGKSTLQSLISAELSKNQVPHICTFEPGDNHIGEAIRKLLLEKKGLNPLTELLLFCADRKEHIEKIIRPGLEAGKIVICDRYFYSTIAFQSFGQGLPISLLHELNYHVLSGIYPDLVILLDIDPQEGLKRTKSRSTEVRDKFETEELSFHKRLREGFLEQAKMTSEAFLILDALNSPESLLKRVMPHLESLQRALNK